MIEETSVRPSIATQQTGTGNTRPDVSIVIACYNEAGHLLTSMEELDRVMRNTRCTYEYIFVDDVSQDDTRHLIESLCVMYANARCIFHEENRGRGGAVMTGLKSAAGRYAGFLDIDLEVHARYLPSMLAALDEGADVAVAERIYKIHLTPLFILRHLLSVSYKRLVQMMLKLPYADSESGYKFFNMESMTSVILQTRYEDWFWDTEVMALAHAHGKKVTEIPALFIRNASKKSTVRIVHDTLKYMKDLATYRKRMKRHADQPYL